MHTPVHTIVRNLFHCDSLEEVSEDQLQDYIKSFPYSSVGHLLLARKIKEQGRDYTSESATAALYVSNPLWLHCFLGATENTEPAIESRIQQGLSQPEITPEVVNVELPEHVAETAQEPVHEIVTEQPDVQDLQTPELSHEHSPEPVPDPEVSKPVHEEPVTESTVLENEVVFEPYHTIDYFASQGIKLRAEDLAKDKLGRQLKSFTDWLRTMKRIAPVTGESPLTSETPDPAIVKKAEESVETSDIETEAMAEVWIKQGKPARAAAIYRKLSLLNPSKSHYFAAKIEQLNA